MRKADPGIQVEILLSDRVSSPVNLRFQHSVVEIETRTGDNAFVRSDLSVVRTRQEDGMNDARMTERGTCLPTVDPALERAPRENERKRGREKGRDLEDWIVAEDRRLVNQLVRALQRAGA